MNLINLIHRYLLVNPSSIEALTALNHCLQNLKGAVVSRSARLKATEKQVQMENKMDMLTTKCPSNDTTEVAAAVISSSVNRLTTDIEPETMTNEIDTPTANSIDVSAQVSYSVTKCREKKCTATFSDASNARRHERQQHGIFDKQSQKWFVKKFVCLLCSDKDFVSKGNFNLHNRNYHDRKTKKKTPNFKIVLSEVSAPEFVKKM